MGDILCAAAYFVLFEKKRKQHQHASIVHNPPHINVAFVVTLMVAGVERHIFGNQQSQMSCSCAANSTCPGREEHSYFQILQESFMGRKTLLTEQVSAKHKSHHLNKEKYVQQGLHRQVSPSDKGRIKQTLQEHKLYITLKKKQQSSKLSMRRQHLLCSNLIK